MSVLYQVSLLLKENCVNYIKMHLKKFLLKKVLELSFTNNGFSSTRVNLPMIFPLGIVSQITCTAPKGTQTKIVSNY